MTRQYEDHILTTRGTVQENRHRVHAAIVDAGNNLLLAVGDPERVTLVRSTIKPAQALAILETGALSPATDPAFTAADLALVCASHSSEDRHVARATALLARVPGGATEADLRCGGHDAVSPAVNRRWIRHGFVPGPLCNNCWGKHAAMLAGAAALGAGFADYHLPAHPMQARVRSVVEDLCGLSGDQVLWAVDGCNLPAPAVPLRNLATTFARFAAAADEVAQTPVGAATMAPSARTEKMARIYHAMAQHPEMVAGEGRFCTILMELFGGALIGKLGADGCYAIGIRESEHTRRLGAKGALGLAVKIEDGSIEILYTAVVEILLQLGIEMPPGREELLKFHQLKRKNTWGVETGIVTPVFKVRAAEAGEV
ncbi:hypothetical protein VD0004_g1991 [Verticillium dahliae]|uniref:L-asparaginase II n=1 Tax=Verticillium dahliae TaxID=27337 RepID=A0A444S7R1_VERDA|nr:hypothetical protein VD0004_g1991 [Verticillium dahliae]PNH73935.1 hypothetical protein VD0001_g3644 [Verticillium dahliae]RXG49441.1 hypothetical protein VDGE_05118 [Verticillium dahliae]